MGQTKDDETFDESVVEASKEKQESPIADTSTPVKKTWGKAGSKKPLPKKEETKPIEKIELKPTRPVEKKPMEKLQLDTPSLKPLKRKPVEPKSNDEEIPKVQKPSKPLIHQDDRGPDTK